MKAYICIITGIAVVALLLLLSAIKHNMKEPPTYSDFTRHRSKEYYYQFAEACDQLIVQIPTQGTNETRLRGDDPRLPKLLIQMNATFIEIMTNRVSLVVDTAAGFAVVWQKDDFNPHLWNLTVRSEAEPLIVFKETK